MDISEKFAGDVVVTLGSVVRVLENQHELLFHVNHQVAETQKAVAIMAKQALKMSEKSKTGFLVPVLIGVGIGVYLAKKSGKVEVALQQPEVKRAAQDVRETWRDAAAEGKAAAAEATEKVVRNVQEKVNPDNRPNAQYS